MLKDAAYEELVDAIRKVAAGQSYVAPALGAKLAVQAESTADDELSEREREVLTLLAGLHQPGDRGAAVRQRPHRRVHRAHILTKLRLSTRADLVNYALESGLLRPEQDG